MQNHDKQVSTNASTKTLTYMPWYEHLRDFVTSQWKMCSLYFIATLGVFWGIVEVISFFYPNAELGNVYVLSAILIGCLFSALIRSLHIYKNYIPVGLEYEGEKARKIAFSKKPFWEYALGYEIISNRINDIDRNLDDVLNNRVHVKVVRVLGELEYIDWIRTRPENLLRLVEVTKQLLLFDLIDAIHADENNDVDYQNLVRVADLIKNAYRSAYEYEIEGREIKFPSTFNLVHEIQSGWASVIRDGYRQMLNILSSVAMRKKGDLSPLEQVITFEQAPRIDEFNEELEKISKSLDQWLVE